MSDRLQLYKYKGNKCTYCGKSVSEMIKRFGTFHRMFDLHHINPSKKDPNYSNLIKQKISAKQIDEVDKCVLLCKTCHGLVHAQNTKAQVKLELCYENRTVEQILEGWLIYDAFDRKLSFISEDKILLTPYYSQVNEQEPNLLFGGDFNGCELLFNVLRSLKKGDVYMIANAVTSEVQFKMTHEGSKVKVEHNVKFPFLQIDVPRDNKKPGLWYRNGIVLTEDGEVIERGVITFYMEPKLKLNEDVTPKDGD